MINLLSSADFSLDAPHTNRKQKNIYNQDIKSLFLDITKRIDQNSIEALNKFIPIDEIIQDINETDPILIIQFVKQITFYLSKIKMEYEEKLQKLPQEEDQNNYESLIQKLEAEVRQHIRIESQQRLHIENLQQKLEEITSSNSLLEDNIGLKDQEINSVLQQLQSVESKCYTIADSQRNSTSRVHKSQERHSTKLNKIHQMIPSHQINFNTSSQTNQQASTSNISSVPSSMQDKKYISVHKNNAIDKLNELISSEKPILSTQKKNKSIINGSVNQLPCQIQALFSKVCNEREQVLSKSQQSKASKNNISGISKMTNGDKQFQTCYKEKDDSRSLTRLQQMGADKTRTFQRTQQQDTQPCNHNHTTNTIIQNLETQFGDTDKKREEMVKQIGQAHQYRVDAYLSYRDNSLEKSQKEIYQNELKKFKALAQQRQVKLINKKQNLTQPDLTKSSSYDGSNKLIQQQRKEVKVQPQNSSSPKKPQQYVNNHLKKKTYH